MHKEILFNIIDTPGRGFYCGSRTFHALDGLIALFSAVDGVEPQSETVWLSNRLDSPYRFRKYQKWMQVQPERS